MSFIFVRFWIITKSIKFFYWVFIFNLSISSFTFSLSLRWIRSLRVKSNNFTISSPVASSFKNSFKAWNNLFHTEKHFVSLLETKCFPCLKLLVSNKVETNYEIALLIFLWWWNQRVEIWFDYELVQTPTFAHMMNLYTLLVGHIYSAWWVYIPTTLDI